MYLCSEILVKTKLQRFYYQKEKNTSKFVLQTFALEYQLFISSEVLPQTFFFSLIIEKTYLLSFY